MAKGPSAAAIILCPAEIRLRIKSYFNTAVRMASIQNVQRDGVVAGLAFSGQALARLDIDQLLLSQPDTFNLFLLALERLQSANAIDKMAWYQVAGISVNSVSKVVC